MDNKYCVYIHINQINGKRYIGITSRKPEKRWKSGYGYKSSPHFYAAIIKYGWENFDHIVLFQNLEEQEAKSKEKELIKEYQSNNSLYGYNYTDGGDGSCGLKFSEETINKLKQQNFGKRMSEEAKNKISIFNKGKKLSPKVVQDLILRQTGSNNSNARPIVQLDNCYNLIREYGCISEASKFLNIGQVSIRQVCSKKIQSTHGFVFMYKEEYENNKKELINQKAKINGYRKEVIQYDLNGIQVQSFDSIVSASKILNINKGSISTACNGRSKTAGGYIWKFVL